MWPRLMSPPGFLVNHRSPGDLVEDSGRLMTSAPPLHWGCRVGQPGGLGSTSVRRSGKLYKKHLKEPPYLSCSRAATACSAAEFFSAVFDNAKHDFALDDARSEVEQRLQRWSG